MDLLWNAGRLTDFGALIATVVVTVIIFRAVIARAHKTGL